jgi:hypothetical protein
MEPPSHIISKMLGLSYSPRHIPSLPAPRLEGPRAVTEIATEAEVEEEWRDHGVEVVRTHTRDRESLKEAFRGEKSIFSASDYWLWLEPEGIVAIRFQDEESASQFIETNHGRGFGDGSRR